MSYSKPWLSVDDQLDLLQSRGLVLGDRKKAHSCLTRIGYYRLSGYWYAFRERTELCCPLPKGVGKVKTEKLALDEFKDGASFQNVVDLYIFDKKLRLLAMDALERIEIALRVEISHTLGKMDTFAYLKPECFHADFSQCIDTKTGVTKHHEWLGKHAQLITRSREEFVKHNSAKGGLPLAIWVACEVWDFGTLSKLFGGMRVEEQDLIAKKFDVLNGRIFATWLRSLNHLRNVCAHHCRLWNRNILEQPKLPHVNDLAWVKDFEVDNHARARCYLLLVICVHLLGIINPSSTWKRRMREHLLTFPDLDHIGLNLLGMGVTKGLDAFQ